MSQWLINMFKLICQYNHRHPSLNGYSTGQTTILNLKNVQPTNVPYIDGHDLIKRSSLEEHTTGEGKEKENEERGRMGEEKVRILTCILGR